jgi:uncharacterized protein YecT (DUF1311 family)
MAAPHLFASIVLGLATATPGGGDGAYPNTSTFGVPFSQDEDWYRQCMRVEALAPAPAEVKAPADCIPSELYDRKRNQARTTQAEWEQVRACALEKNDNGVLMMLYANGYGVARDTDRAIHHACVVDFIAKAEMEHRIAHLATRSENDKPFDLCDDVTSGTMGAVCTSRREAQDSRVRNLRLDRAARALPAASRVAFARLREAADTYATKAGYEETDARGTAAADVAYRNQARLREQAMQAMLDTIAGKLPQASAAQCAEWDRQLNATYGEVMAIASTQDGHPDRIGDSTIEHAAVRNAERLWLAYRDAFVAFRASLGTGSDPDAIKALLTEQRVAQLRRVPRER